MQATQAHQAQDDEYMRHAPRWSIAPLGVWPIEQVLAVQRQAYAPHLVEDAAVLLHKIRSADAWQCDFSFGVAESARPAHLCGYAIACPWQTGLAPQWNHATAVDCVQADCLYVHDIAIAPTWHGNGLAGMLMRLVLRQARVQADVRGWRYAALVAVQGADAYWQRLGFVPDAASAPDLRSFGADAVWMTHSLAQQASP